jgi:YD repeat-containing protein
MGKTDASGNGVSYTYSDSGVLHTRTWARGITTTYNYDAAGRLASLTYSDGTPGASFGYGPTGNVTTSSQLKAATSSQTKNSEQGSSFLGLRNSLPHGPQQRRISFHLPSERLIRQARPPDSPFGLLFVPSKTPPIPRTFFNTRATHIQTTGGGGSRRGDSP